MKALPSILRNHVTQLRVTFDPKSPCLSSEPGAERGSDRSDTGGGWDGGLHPLWPVVGPHQDLQVGGAAPLHNHWLFRKRGGGAMLASLTGCVYTACWKCSSKVGMMLCCCDDVFL